MMGSRLLTIIIVFASQKVICWILYWSMDPAMAYGSRRSRQRSCAMRISNMIPWRADLLQHLYFRGSPQYVMKTRDMPDGDPHPCFRQLLLYWITFTPPGQEFKHGICLQSRWGGRNPLKVSGAT